MFSTLKGQKLGTEYLLSVCLSKGDTLATWNLYGIFPFNIIECIG